MTDNYIFLAVFVLFIEVICIVYSAVRMVRFYKRKERHLYRMDEDIDRLHETISYHKFNKVAVKVDEEMEKVLDKGKYFTYQLHKSADGKYFLLKIGK